jgi:hypothetical protein
MQVQLVGITSFSHQDIIKLYKERTGESPARGIDSVDMNAKLPKGIISIIEGKNNPRPNLFNPNLLRFVHVCFLVVNDDRIIGSSLQSTTNLDLYTSQVGDDYFTYVSGSLEQWYLFGRMKPSDNMKAFTSKVNDFFVRLAIPEIML